METRQREKSHETYCAACEPSKKKVLFFFLWYTFKLDCIDRVLDQTLCWAFKSSERDRSSYLTDICL